MTFSPKNLACALLIALLCYSGMGAWSDLLSEVEDLSDIATVAKTLKANKKEKVSEAILPGLADLTLHFVGHAHIDLVYRWRWNETVHRVARDTFRGILSLMEKDPDVLFLQSQPALYKAMQKEYPAIFAGILDRIQEGRWEVVGPSWSETDLTMPSGESILRNHLYGIHYCREELGVDSRIVFAPDAFTGMAATLPQLFAGCGMKYFVSTRNSPKDKKVFWWEGTDGSRILSYTVPIRYNVSPSTLRERDAQDLLDYSTQASGLKDILILYGEGDHGGGPRSGDMRAIRTIKGDERYPKAEHSTLKHYLESIVEPIKDQLPVHQGALGNPKSSMQYTSQSRAKKANRDAENLLLAAEKFNTLGTFYQRKPNFPRVDFQAAWEPVMEYQFHDALPGTANGRVFDDMEQGYAWVMEEGEALLKQGLEYIGNRIDTRGAGVPLVIYNALSWPRTDIVETSVRFVESTPFFSIEDPAGDALQWQALSVSEDQRHWKICFVAKDIPATGFKLYRVHPRRSAILKGGLSATADSLENEFFRLSLGEDGLLKGIWDKKGSRDLLSKGGKQFSLWEEEDGSCWSSDYTGTKEKPRAIRSYLVETGPVRAVIRSEYATQASTFSVDTILYDGVPRIDFTFQADWHDSDSTLMLSFETSVEKGEAAISRPYGFETVPPQGQRLYGQQWVDLSESDYGIGLLSDAKYEYYVEENRIRMSMLRNARDLDPRMDEGAHRFRYAIYPHSGDWRDSGLVAQARALNQPLIAQQESWHSGAISSWSGRGNKKALPPVCSLVSVDNPNIEIPVVKMEHEAWTIPQSALVIRAFESSGRASEGKITLPFRVLGAMSVTHVEDAIRGEKIPVEGKSFHVSLKANQLRSYRVMLAWED